MSDLGFAVRTFMYYISTAVPENTKLSGEIAFYVITLILLLYNHNIALDSQFF